VLDGIAIPAVKRGLVAPHLVQSLLMQGHGSHPDYFAIGNLEAVTEVYCHEFVFDKLVDPWTGPGCQWLHAIPELPFLGDVHCVGPYVDGADSPSVAQRVSNAIV
jgi:hypothetical protein